VYVDAVPLEIPSQTPCSFCENFAGRDPWHGRPAVVHEDDFTYVIIAPASLGGMPGHTLVIPRRHVETILDLTKQETVDLASMVRRAARAIDAAMDPDGILIVQRNGVTAGQTVPHVHFHVIPRREGTVWPPTEWVENTPSEVRVAQASLIRPHF